MSFRRTGAEVWRICTLMSDTYLNGGRIFLRDGSDPKNYYQIFDKEEYLPLMVEGFNPCVILDLGAYIGLSAIYFRIHFPDALIICVEPSPDNFEVLQRNIAPYDIIPIHAAVWGENTPLGIYEVFDGDWGTRISSHVNGNIKPITINDIVKQFDIPRIDLLKMDIEGSERNVFTQNTEWINLVDCCAVELHDRFFGGCRQAFEGLFSKDVFDIQQESEITIARRHE